MENPLEHFELHILIPLRIFGLDISINQAVVMMWVVCAAIFFFFWAATRQSRLVPAPLQNVAEVGVEFLRGMVLDNMGEKGMRLFPVIGTLFFFIFFSNLLGLIPGTYTVTSQVMVNGALALGIFLLSVIVGLMFHGFHYFSIFVPPGTPWWLMPMMIPVELISQLARPVTLAVRLFANMTAGHTTLAVLFGMVISIPLIPVPLAVKIGLLFLLVLLIASRHRVAASKGMWGLIVLYSLVAVILSVLWIRWLPLVGSIAMNGLEVLIAFIQAYVFTVLATVYLGDAIRLH